MATSDLNTTERMRIGGSMAEQAFEDWFPHKWFRMGLDQPDWSDGTPVGAALPRALSSLPDYVTYIHEPSFVECIGAKGDIVRSTKIQKIEWLKQWRRYTGMPTYLFIYNSSKQSWLLIEVTQLPVHVANRKQFHDNVQYWEFQWVDLVADAKLVGECT